MMELRGPYVEERTPARKSDRTSRSRNNHCSRYKKGYTPKAIPRAVLLQRENRPFPRTLSSQNDSISYKRKRVAVCADGGKGVARACASERKEDAISDVPKTNCRHHIDLLNIYMYTHIHS